MKRCSEALGWEPGAALTAGERKGGGGGEGGKGSRGVGLGARGIESPAPLTPFTPPPSLPGKLVSALAFAQEQVTVPGSCTVCACALNAERGTLEVANLGDSGLRVLRGGSVVFATKQQEHQVGLRVLRAGGGGRPNSRRTR